MRAHIKALTTVRVFYTMATGDLARKRSLTTKESTVYRSPRPGLRINPDRPPNDSPVYHLLTLVPMPDYNICNIQGNLLTEQITRSCLILPRFDLNLVYYLYPITRVAMILEAGSKTNLEMFI